MFASLALWASNETGRARSFAVACALVLLWGVTGPFFHFSDAWQLVINTGTTILTWLMLFLLQNTQNRDTAAIQLKLDVLIKAAEKAPNQFIGLEELTEEELRGMRLWFTHLARRNI
jgi:low affinity Fe/Cu permease